MGRCAARSSHPRSPRRLLPAPRAALPHQPFRYQSRSQMLFRPPPWLLLLRVLLLQRARSPRWLRQFRPQPEQAMPLPCLRSGRFHYPRSCARGGAGVLRLPWTAPLPLTRRYLPALRALVRRTYGWPCGRAWRASSLASFPVSRPRSLPIVRRPRPWSLQPVLEWKLRGRLRGRRQPRRRSLRYPAPGLLPRGKGSFARSFSGPCL